MTEGSLTNLAILSIERETVEQVDFTKLIENFAAVRARKVFYLVVHRSVYYTCMMYISHRWTAVTGRPQTVV